MGGGGGPMGGGGLLWVVHTYMDLEQCHPPTLHGPQPLSPVNYTQTTFPQ